MLADLIHIIGVGVFLTTAYPLWRAWRSSADTSLRYAMIWTILAWLGWLVVGVTPFFTSSLPVLHYQALCLCACAVVAVLGARRPGLGAWNLVTAGLLAVLMLPILTQAAVSEGWQLEGPWVIFLGLILAVGAVNFLPTLGGLAEGAGVIGLLCYAELLLLIRPTEYDHSWRAALTLLLVASSVWIGYAFMPAWPRANVTPDALWKAFRDRYGLVWSWRVQEQFNHAAANAGLPVRLTWRGLRPMCGERLPSEADNVAILQTLQAVLKRFGPEP